MMLVLSELAEAMEGHRKGLMDDHLPDYPMLHVEMADAAIRLLDLAGAYYIEVGRYELEMIRFLNAIELAGDVREQLFAICKFLTTQPEHGFDCLPIRQGLYSIFAFCQFHKIDLAKLIDLKLAYNRQRADHKLEALADLVPTAVTENE